MPQLNLLKTAQPIGIVVSITLRQDGRWTVGASCIDHTGKITVSVQQTARPGTQLELASVVVQGLVDHWIGADENDLGQVLDDDLRMVHRISQSQQ